ncbi:MAG: hypothetical protein L3V56_11610 [Candidatus Magnetoovum sp. WYHC-5]|nr:hypothetical protein [Candidatus Magnetoovum sp. WYHC-5]
MSGEQIIVEVNYKMRDRVEVFVGKKKREVDDLKQDISKGDYAGLQLVGKSIKNNANKLGLAKIVEFGEAIESAAGLKDSGRLKDVMGEYYAYLDAVKVIGVE